MKEKVVFRDGKIVNLEHRFILEEDWHAQGRTIEIPSSKDPVYNGGAFDVKEIEIADRDHYTLHGTYFPHSRGVYFAKIEVKGNRVLLYVESKRIIEWRR